MRVSVFKRPVVFTGFLLVLAVAARADTLPFAPGEKLSYEVRWEQVPVAQVSLEVRPVEQIQGTAAFHFMFRARTYPVLNVFYPVEGTIAGCTDLGLTRALRLEKDMQEGWTRRAYRVEYDWKRGIATYLIKGKARRSIALAEGTLDMISILYYVRSLPLEVGLEKTKPVSSGKKIYQITARVVRKEAIQIGGRSWQAFLIEPDVHKAGGIFRKSAAPRLRLWISADDRKIPLKIVSKVWLGSFIIELADKLR